MNKKNVTKHALFASIVSMFLCCTMFIGTTYAWFTDSVTSANNKIESGTLDVDFLKYNEDTQGYESIANKEGAIFTEKNGTKWEPGKTEVVHFQVKNNGTLYLKYDFLISVLNQGLIGSLDYAIVEGDYNDVSTLDSWEKIVERVEEANVKALEEGKYTIFSDQTLAPKDNADNGDEKYFALAIHMREGVSNEYQGKAVSIDASIFATQASVESDGFNETYDAAATYSYVTHDGEQDFQALWDETSEGYTIYLEKSVNIAGLTVDKNMTVDAAGNEFVVVDDVVFSEGKSLTIKNAKMNSLSVTGVGTLGLTSVTIDATSDEVATISETETKVDALALHKATVNLVVKGYTVLTGAANGNGIYVDANSTLDLSGTGKLVAVGNAGTEDKTVTIGGSGIGGEGTIHIHDMANLTAEGYGYHAFGIGGNGVDVSIKTTNIAYVKGGYVQQNLISNPQYGESEPEGGAAIGGAKITLDGVTIEKAEGGSKAAGIGGSCIRREDYVNQTVSITIVDSTVNAIGGEYGAGIGSGYDTHCSELGYTQSPICTINIKGSSKISAQGGRYAAGIGTGYHAGGLAGAIESTVELISVNSGEKFCKDAYTQAQDIGFGVVDPAREGLTSVGCTFDNQGTEVKVVFPETTTE